MVYEKVLSDALDVKEGWTLDSYMKRKGYDGIRKTFKDFSPKETIDYMKEANVRGRGGAGFSAGMKWSFVPETDKPKYLCVNADESEPGTFKDRLIMAEDPHLLIEGIMVCCYAINANHCYIFVRGEFVREINRLNGAIKELKDKGWLGKGNKLLGEFDFELDIVVTGGAGAYICGEETGLISAQEGGRAYPKIKPPFPAVEGYFRNPTVVNNVETLACAALVMARGKEWFLGIGPANSPGPKLFCLSGHLNKRGVVEGPMGLNLKELIESDEYGGGVRGGALKAVIPGGSSVPILLPDKIDVAMDFDSVREVGSLMGSCGVIVMNEHTCMVNALYNLARFYHHESCGQCTPCREGTGWLEQILHRLEYGHGKMKDLEMLESICWQMERRTICFLADSIVMPVKSYLEAFRDEFVHHIEHKTCMTGTKAGKYNNPEPAFA